MKMSPCPICGAKMELLKNQNNFDLAFKHSTDIKCPDDNISISVVVEDAKDETIIKWWNDRYQAAKKNFIQTIAKEQGCNITEPETTISKSVLKRLSFMESGLKKKCSSKSAPNSSKRSSTKKGVASTRKKSVKKSRTSK